MKLNVDQLQKLSIILQKLNSKREYTKCSLLPTKLVISLNNSLWTGDFVILEDYDFIKDFESPFEDDWLDLTNYPFNSKFDMAFRNFHIGPVNMISLLNFAKEYITTSEKLGISPILHNAINLETNTKLPFLILDENTSYNLVSIIETNNK